MKNAKLFILILIGIVLVGAALLKYIDFNAPEGGVPPPTRIQAPSEEPGTTPLTASPPAGETPKQVLKFVIEGDEFSFLPQNITVPRGATVELTFKNIGRVPHNY
ncbi:MAG: hypothetical protein WAP23_01805, partial [Candidatus Spechtbacterales bacterium]